MRAGDRVKPVGIKGRWYLVSCIPDEFGDVLVKHMDSLSQLHRHPSNLIKI
jgi:hypothetical protein